METLGAGADTGTEGRLIGACTEVGIAWDTTGADCWCWYAG